MKDGISVQVDGAHERLPDPVQQPHAPVFLAGATERSIAVAGRPLDAVELNAVRGTRAPGRKVSRHLAETTVPLPANPARGNIGIARLVYVAETDAIARPASCGT